MSSIGPEIPAHLQQSIRAQTAEDESEDESSFGPQIPQELLKKAPSSPSPRRPSPKVGTSDVTTSSPRREANDESDDDDYGPALPPELMAARAGPSKPTSVSSNRPVGPLLPSQQRFYQTGADDDSDDDIGPQPLPANVKVDEPNAVQRFMEAEEKRRKNAEDAAKPKAPKRDEWMLVPPSSSDLLGGLDPTRLTKSRMFSRSTTATTTKPDNSLWTETPAERQQRLADEVSGKKRRAENQTEDPDVTADRAKRRREDEALRQGVDAYTNKVRGPALVAQHSATLAAGPSKKEDPVIWDHSRDMAIGGRLIDDDKRNQMVREARSLGDRFGSGKRGGFL
ncbi:hypothetical protein BDN72DRAFT_764479 [Pluteus cervinus]|uniref:Uncharacterized protein n=1 Tax=Pluteus cervinus TaxID=181527 RepID=A0ACD3B401_9AGAR|nr:hypothetical protein BDN72DRAFT_764479 [Pluteus cervinus]